MYTRLMPVTQLRCWRDIENKIHLINHKELRLVPQLGDLIMVKRRSALPIRERERDGNYHAYFAPA